MRRLLTALASLAVLALIVPSVGLAMDPPVDNGTDAILAVYVDYDAGTGDESAAANVINPVPAATAFNVYFVMYYPRVPSQSLGGFEFSWSLQPGNTAPLVLSATYPPSALNIGTTTNLIVGLGDPYDFTGSTHKVLVTLSLFFAAAPAAPEEMFLSPADPASIAGFMAYDDYYNVSDVRTIMPNSVGGAYNMPVFGFGEPTAVETANWGSLKALFQ